MVKRKNLLIYDDLSDELFLKEIDYSDSDCLRIWKNNNREAFFFTEIITPEMQKKWMEKYYKDPDDFMFVVSITRKKIGVMGFKTSLKGAEIYNVILGDTKYGGRGAMSRGMNLMNSYIVKLNIERTFLRVLNSNVNAIRWYTKNGFVDKGVCENYHLMELDNRRFIPNKIRVEES